MTLRVSVGTEPDDLPFGHNTGAPRGPHETLDVVLQPGDWLAYDLNVTRAEEYDVVVLGASADLPALWVDGRPVRLARHGKQSTSWQADPVALGAGRHELRIGATTTELTVAELRVL